jgi:long-chain acyl-CoA synthetase
MTTARTLCDIFFESVDTYRKPDHLRVKRDGAWRDVGSDEYRQAVEEISMGLRGLGIAPGDRVAILSENRPEWAFADLATLAAGAVDVPIYTTLSAAQILHLLNDSGSRAIFVSSPALVETVSSIRGQALSLAHVIAIDPVTAPNVLALDELRARGRAALAADPQAVRRQAALVKPEDVATIIYTSGTTGDPKGVMLTHDNLVSNVDACDSIVPELGPSESCLSFLPLCHVFERLGGHYLMLKHGATIAYAESVEKVPANLLEIRPSALLSVPRLYEKIFARIQEKVAADSAISRGIFNWALGVGRRALPDRLARRPSRGLLGLQVKLADALVFGKIRARTGGRLRLMVSGGAPLSPEIAAFFAAAGMPIQEGYGLTETSPVICANRPFSVRIGTVGTPIPGVEVKIAEDGEILSRGRHIMKGYFGKPEATAEVLDPDGWFHTGDIGAFDADGYLRITDRKKDLIVTSGGKKVAPQPIENHLKTNPFVAEIVLVGDKRRFPGALIVPRFEPLEAWAKDHNVPGASREELVRRPEVLAHYERLIAEMTPHLAQFERIKRIALLPREFSLEGGELTPTLKVKRKVIEQRYKDVIDRLYEGESAA